MGQTRPTLRSPSDVLTIGVLESALMRAREENDQRAALEILAASIAELGVRAAQTVANEVTTRDRDAWLRRLASMGRSKSTISAYRLAIDDLRSWAARTGRADELFEESGIVDYLDEYRRRCAPAPATYHRRFLLLRCFMQWLSRRTGIADPFLDLQAPAKARKERDWLSYEEFSSILACAAKPTRRRSGLAERDRLVLLALVLTGLRRSELIDVRWRDLDTSPSCPSLLVKRGKGAKPRRQPLPAQLVQELEARRRTTTPSPDDYVFCGLQGGKLSATALTRLLNRCARPAGLSKHVTAHTLRHTAATWLRQATGDVRLVAEYLGHTDISTVSLYAHVAEEEMHSAVQSFADRLLGADAQDDDQDRNVALAA